MICANADNCPWLQRFGIGACRRHFMKGICKPIDEGSDCNEETPAERGKEAAEGMPEVRRLDGRCGH